jgi:CheY-like chemotaxis protein
VALLRIINDILDFSKVEAGKLELEQVDFVLADCVGNTVDLLRGRATAKGLAISVRVAADVPPAVRGDPSRLGQILTNLVGNAVKFTERGSIDVSVELAGHVDGDVVLRFEVADHGIGIAPAAQETIFDAFHQADGGTSRRYGGTGLGLAICRQLAHLLGGEIGVCSHPGEGSTFWFTVRLAVADAPAIHEGSALPTAGPDSMHVAAAPVPSTTRVLLAEDNAVNRHVALAMLRSLGFSADTAVDGREAVDATARVRYDVVLMDCHMPGMDGFSATAMIRERDALTGAPRVPIVALTANAMTGDREACIAGGMDDYLSKPFTRAQLQALLERWATSPAPGIETPPASAGA